MHGYGAHGRQVVLAPMAQTPPPNLGTIVRTYERLAINMTRPIFEYFYPIKRMGMPRGHRRPGRAASVGQAASADPSRPPYISDLSGCYNIHTTIALYHRRQ